MLKQRSVTGAPGSGGPDIGPSSIAKPNVGRAGRGFSIFQRFTDNEKGASLPLFAAALFPLLGMTGVAVDVSRAYVVRAQLSTALDSAVLAGAKEGRNATARDAAIGRYLGANFPTNYLGSTLTPVTITPAGSGDGSNQVIDLTVRVSAKVPTTFMRIFGSEYAYMNVHASTRAATAQTVGTSNALEIVMAIDNTGSMEATDVGGGMSRIAAVKAAARQFTNIVYNGTASHENLAIGIVPFTVMANTGRLLKAGLVNDVPDYTSRAASDKWGWKGCVAEDGWWSGTPRTGILSSDRTKMDATAYDLSLDNPATTAAPKWDPFLYPPVAILAWQNVQNMYKAPSNSFAGNPDSVWFKAVKRGYETRAATGLMTLYKGNGDINLNNLEERTYLRSSGGDRDAATIDYGDWSEPSNYGQSTKWNASPNFHCPAEALPPRWGVQKQTILDYIDDQNDAYMPGTGTFTHTGFVWAWRFLKAKDMFVNVVDNPKGLPTRKALVLFTDGIIDANDRGNRWDDKRDTNYTPYGTYEERLVSTSSSPNNVKSAMDLRLAKTCAAAKSSGVTVYVVALKASSNTYKECASSPQHFFQTYSADELNTAFEAIAYDLVPLHLVE